MTNNDKTKKVIINDEIDKDSLYYNILTLNGYVDKDIERALKEYKKDIDKDKINDFVKDKDYWLNQLDIYIKHLIELDKENIDNISEQELKNTVVNFNVDILKNFFIIKRQYARDLISDKLKYAFELASTIVDLQIIEINNIGGINAFCKLNLDKDKTLKQIMKTPLLKETQDTLKERLKEKSIDNVVIDEETLKLVLFSHQQEDSINNVEKIISDDREYYNKLHRKYNKIDKLTTQVGKKYVKRDKELKELNKVSEDIQIVEQKDDAIVKKDFTKLPTTYTIDFDIMKLFNNIYPNYKYKSIDEDRHKDLNIQAKLILDLDLETDDTATRMQNMRLINFIKNGKITLYPIQSALINGFISIRDNQENIDKVIPLLSTLKYITSNRALRLPTSKKDLQLYEDFMTFFDRCKMQVKIEDRATKRVLFEIMKPISILSNTPAYNGKYGYVIGNSVLNLLKNELDNIYSTPNQTTIKTSKSYLQNKLPSTPTTINLNEFILPKILQMINSYKKRGIYNGKINIITLYDFQAMYNKHPKPTKDDKAKARETLDKYLDNLIDKDLIVSYTPIFSGKEINQYKIEINKNANI